METLNLFSLVFFFSVVSKRHYMPNIGSYSRLLGKENIMYEYKQIFWRQYLDGFVKKITQAYNYPHITENNDYILTIRAAEGELSNVEKYTA